ncbi:uncharacterized protein PAE49_000734 [Odontesthes bonariensis]|uniref:uncharacterized protein LOC142374572 n=1 Tax=Odontesthes bonariensis TaxID=219752 RepID=UPI003F5833C7
MQAVRALVADRLAAAAGEISSAAERMLHTSEMSAEERRAVVSQRLRVVAEEIFRIFEMTTGGLEASRSHQENERQYELVNVTWKTEARWHRTDKMPSSGSEQQKCSNRPRVQDASTQTDSEFISGKPSHFQTRPVGKDTRSETETQEEHCEPNDDQGIKSSPMQPDAESSDGERDDRNPTKEGARLQEKRTKSEGSHAQRRSLHKHCKDWFDLKYICKVCGKSFCYRASFLKHVQEHKSDTDVCALCGKHFESEESLRLHWSRAAGRSCCRVCGKFFRSNRSFLKHVLEHEQSTDVCGVCGKQLDSNDGLKLHLQTHNEENDGRDQTDARESEAEGSESKGGESDEDWRKSEGSEGSDGDDGGSEEEEGTQGSSLPKESKAKAKESRNKDLSHQKYCCKVCGKSFCYRASFFKHVQEDERQAGFCGVCGEHFGTEESLRLHLQTYIRSHDCEVCGKQFDGHRQLEMHTRTHTGEKPFVCSVCGKAFAQNGNLTGHMKVHTGEKPYVCSVCGQSFSFKEYMRAHMRIHTGERPFLCSVCGKGFRQRGTLKTHMMIHTGESTHRCLICDKKFYKSGALKIHMRSHTGEKPYLCNVCGKSFSAGGSLTKHMGVIHTADHSVTPRGGAAFEKKL